LVAVKKFAIRTIKDEFQLVIDMPEERRLEHRTDFSG